VAENLNIWMYAEVSLQSRFCTLKYISDLIRVLIATFQHCMVSVTLRRKQDVIIVMFVDMSSKVTQVRAFQ